MRRWLYAKAVAEQAMLTDLRVKRLSLSKELYKRRALHYKYSEHCTSSKSAASRPTMNRSTSGSV
jgi:hypothetical protein